MKHILSIIVIIGALINYTAAQDDRFKPYANYDFQPGDHIVFEDDFATDDDGEFPAHWNLLYGQGIINKVNGIPTFVISTGYTEVEPRVKTKSYLENVFTVEFDYYLGNEGESNPPRLYFKDTKEGQYSITFSDNVSTSGFATDASAAYPGEKSSFYNAWHHAAVVYKNLQIKCYIDQHRVVVAPNSGIVPTSVFFTGQGDQEFPTLFRNVRIANGGGMKMLNKLTADGKIVTHGILFDVGKASIKPQSMGTVNEIVELMAEHPDLKFSIEGHTDSDGDPGKNQLLSEERAASVKILLIQSGIEASRLTTKGFGASKPIDSNTTLEGKASNRRVEFVKM